MFEYNYTCGNTIIVQEHTVIQTSDKALNFEGLAENIEDLGGLNPDAWAESYHNQFCLECSPENRALLDYADWYTRLVGVAEHLTIPQ